MADVKVSVLRIVDVSQPGFVEFELVDCNGINHHFIDKIPVICDSEKCEYDSIPPYDGYMRCNIIRETSNTVIIDTSKPDGIESLNGEYQFEVYKDQVII